DRTAVGGPAEGELVLACAGKRPGLAPLDGAEVDLSVRAGGRDRPSVWADRSLKGGVSLGGDGAGRSTADVLHVEPRAVPFLDGQEDEPLSVGEQAGPLVEQAGLRERAGAPRAGRQQCDLRRVRVRRDRPAAVRRERESS